MNNTFDQDFCPACGTILPLPDGSSIIQCLLCKKIQDISGLDIDVLGLCYQRIS